ncbi:hypothetical protein BZA77DRAFT_121231 [Pyronema omphalodes]|nr:hypothetical protein BZA77DRAFT_121231 [Pyronema omphalodes]
MCIAVKTKPSLMWQQMNIDQSDLVFASVNNDLDIDMLNINTPDQNAIINNYQLQSSYHAYSDALNQQNINAMAPHTPAYDASLVFPPLQNVQDRTPPISGYGQISLSGYSPSASNSQDAVPRSFSSRNLDVPRPSRVAMKGNIPDAHGHQGRSQISQTEASPDKAHKKLDDDDLLKWMKERNMTISKAAARFHDTGRPYMTEQAVKLRYGQLRRYKENFKQLKNHNKRHRSENPPMLERYLSSDEDESKSTIAAASVVPPLSNPEANLPPRYASSEKSISSAVSDRSSISARSGRSARSSISVRSSISARSSVSARSAGSNTPFQERRRRSKTEVANPGTQTKKNTFQCTFCHISFSNKAIWQRHEDTAHIHTFLWICSRDGTVDSSGRCVFCDGEPALCANDRGCVHSCADKDVQARTFLRQDWMEQHIETVHFRSESYGAAGGFENTPRSQRAKELVKLWKCPQDVPDRSSCGFCGEVFHDWKARRNHIAVHFQSGKTMHEWEGDWGLSPKWMKELLKGKPVVYNNNSAVQIVIEGCT